MKFELHCHSCYSRGSRIPWEGIPRPEDIVRRAKDLGLFGVAITDHGTTESWKPAFREAKKQGILFIPGVELQTRAGHLLALGVSGPVEGGLEFEESVERIHEAGGIAIAPHPFDARSQGAGNLALKADAIEIFNSLSVDRVGNRLASSRFGKSSVPKVAGSDAHTLEMIGRSVNVMEANDVDSVLKSILRGHARLETSYVPIDDVIAWARERLSRSKAEIMGYIDANYFLPKAWLYRKMFKKFLVTSNAPWRALAEMSLQAVRAYEFAKAMTY